MIPLRLVLDTNVCLDLFVFRDPACVTLLEFLQSGRAQAVTCESCRNEWIRVLEYPQFSLDSPARQARLADFDELICRIDTSDQFMVSLPLCSDADDQKFLELARDSGANFLLTKDKALLKLNGKTTRADLFSILSPNRFIAQFLLTKSAIGYNKI